MYRSWMVPVIILFWAVTSGWLVCAKILPTLSVGAAPGYQAFYASGNRLVPVAWTVLWNDQPLGWSTSQARRTPGGGLEVESLLHFDRLPLDEVLPSWSKMLLRQPVAGGESYAFDARGHLAIDAQGELRTFSSVVSLPATPEKLFLHGRIDAGEVTVDVRGHGMNYSASRRLARNIAVGDELSPMATLPGLYANRRWTVPIYSPLRAGQAPIQVLHARVAGEEMMFWDDTLVRVDVVQYRDDPAVHNEPRCTLWVDRGGRVLKQESRMLGSRLVFLRRTDAGAEDLIAGVAPIIDGDLPMSAEPDSEAEPGSPDGEAER